MSDTKKTLKFQMMMSPAEAEVLDNWMFNNRLRSRAEAIRRLVQIGMLVDMSVNDLNAYKDKIMNNLLETLRKTEDGGYEGEIGEVSISGSKILALCLVADNIAYAVSELKANGNLDEIIKTTDDRMNRIKSTSQLAASILDID